MYVQFQRNVLEYNLSQIESFVKSAEDNIKQIHEYMKENDLNEFVVADFDECDKYLDNLYVVAVQFKTESENAITKICYTVEPLRDGKTKENGMIIGYSEELGAEMLYVDEVLYEYTLGLKRLVADALSNVYPSGASSSKSFSKDCQETLIEFLKLNKN